MILQLAKIANSQKNRRLVNANEKPDFFGFPRVWIACSKKVPAKMPVSEFTHIPCDQNLDSKGNLKNAGELIEVYESAGVLKYAEIVCYSDSIKEAAMTYYALRALGYPQVRVYLPQKGAL